MNRNVTIVIIILVLVVIAGYLVWLRSKYQSTTMPQQVIKTEESSEVVPRETPSASVSAKEASASSKEATGATKVKSKIATPSSVKK